MLVDGKQMWFIIIQISTLVKLSKYTIICMLKERINDAWNIKKNNSGRDIPLPYIYINLIWRIFFLKIVMAMEVMLILEYDLILLDIY